MYPSVHRALGSSLFSGLALLLENQIWGSCVHGHGHKPCAQHQATKPAVGKITNYVKNSKASCQLEKTEYNIFFLSFLSWLNLKSTICPFFVNKRTPLYYVICEWPKNLKLWLVVRYFFNSVIILNKAKVVFTNCTIKLASFLKKKTRQMRVLISFENNFIFYFEKMFLVELR